MDDGRIDDPAAALRELDRLRATTRRSGRAWWLPVTLFGVLILGAVPLYWSATAPADTALTDPFLILVVRAFGGIFTAHPVAIAVYWLVALPAGFALSGLWYRRHAERVGLRRPVLAFVVTGLAVTAGLLVLQVVPMAEFLLFWVGARGTAAIAVVAVSLLVLARLERSRPLAVVAVAFLALTVVVSTYNLENVLVRAGLPFGDWTGAVPVLVPGLVLLLVGLSAASGRAARRPRPVAA